MLKLAQKRVLFPDTLFHRKLVAFAMSGNIDQRYQTKTGPAIVIFNDVGIGVHDDGLSINGGFLAPLQPERADEIGFLDDRHYKRPVVRFRQAVAGKPGPVLLGEPGGG